MILNIIMLVTMLPTMLILCIIFRFQGVQNGIFYGVKLEKELAEAPEVKAEISFYRRRHTWFTLLVMLSWCPVLFFKHESIQFTYWMSWFLLSILVINVPYLISHKAMKAFKAEKTLCAQKDLTMQLSRISKLYQDKRDFSCSAESDEHWILGMFYYNPQDKRTMVEKRFGVGTTINMATKTGLFIEVIGLLALLSIPIMCIWMILEDFTPMHIRLEQKEIVCNHVLESYHIPLAEITEARLLDDLPKDRTKRNGSATSTMEKGKFVCNEYGLIYEFITCEKKPYMMIKTADKTYLINSDSKEETLHIYQQIK